MLKYFQNNIARNDFKDDCEQGPSSPSKIILGFPEYIYKCNFFRIFSQNWGNSMIFRERSMYFWLISLTNDDKSCVYKSNFSFFPQNRGITTNLKRKFNFKKYTSISAALQVPNLICLFSSTRILTDPTFNINSMFRIHFILMRSWTFLF